MIQNLSKTQMPLFYPQTNSLNKKIGKYERDLRIDLNIQNQLITEENLTLKIYLEDIGFFGYFNRELMDENLETEHFECNGLFRIDLSGERINKLFNKEIISFNCNLKINIPVKYNSKSHITNIEIKSFYDETDVDIQKLKNEFEDEIKQILNESQTIAVNVIKII